MSNVERSPSGSQFAAKYHKDKNNSKFYWGSGRSNPWMLIAAMGLSDKGTREIGIDE